MLEFHHPIVAGIIGNNVSDGRFGKEHVVRGVDIIFFTAAAGI